MHHGSAAFGCQLDLAGSSQNTLAQKMLHLPRMSTINHLFCFASFCLNQDFAVLPHWENSHNTVKKDFAVCYFGVGYILLCKKDVAASF